MAAKLGPTQVQEGGRRQQRHPFRTVRPDHRERRAQPAQSFAARAAHVPVVPQALAEPDEHLRLAVRARRPLQRCAEVVTLAVEVGEPAPGARAVQVGERVAGEVAVVVGVAATEVALLRGCRRGPGERAGGRQEPEPPVLGLDEAALDEVRQRQRRVAPGNARDRGQVEAAGEHTELPEQRALGFGQQVVAPRDGGCQAPVARRRRAARQQAVVEPVGQRGQRQRRGPRGGQLHGERQPVEASADLGDHGRVVGGDREAGPGGGGAVGEEPHGRARSHLLPAGVRRRER